MSRLCDAQEQVEAFLRGYFDKTPFEITHIQSVNNQIFRVEANGAHYILRLISQTNELESAHEVYAVQEAAKLGVAPRIFSISDAYDMILMEDLGTRSMTAQEAKEHCYEIGQAIYKIHSIPPHPTLTPQSRSFAREGIWRFEEIEKRLSRCKNATLVDRIKGDCDLALHLFLSDVQEVEKHSIERVFVHNDLHPKSVFWTEEGMKAIDWDGAEYASPYFDLSFYTSRQLYTSEEVDRFLQGYFGRLPTQEEKCLLCLTTQMFGSLDPLMSYRIALAILEKDPKQEIILDNPLLQWTDYMAIFMAHEGSVLPAQFYYDGARCALLKAQEAHADITQLSSKKLN